MELDTRNDADLVAATIAGEREAFGQLYDRHARTVRTVVAGVSGDWPAVEDMSQECFLRAYRKLATLQRPDNFKAWIVGIARQVARERRRSLRRDRHEFDLARTLVVEAATDQKSEANDREQLEVVMRALAKLSEQERLAIHAFYFQSKNAHQAAESLGLSRSGFYALLQRATARLSVRVQPLTQKGKE